MKTESNPVKPCQHGCKYLCGCRPIFGHNAATKAHNDSIEHVRYCENAPGAAEVKACYHCGTGGTCWTQCRGTVCCNCKRHLDRKPIQPPAAPIGQAKCCCAQGFTKGECPIHSDAPAPVAEGEIDFESAERSMRFAADRGPNGTVGVGANEGHAYLSLAAKVTELSAAWKAEKREANDYCVENIGLKQALTVANARVEELEDWFLQTLETDETSIDLTGLWKQARTKGRRIESERAARERGRGENPAADPEKPLNRR